MNKTKVCHLTTVHKRYDIRIFRKECVSLARAGYDVTLLINDTLPDEIFEGVHIRSTQWVPKNKIERLLMAPNKLLDLALSINADVYHYHDPDLHRIALRLIVKGKSVIYDCHEDTENDIRYNKFWIPTILRPIIALCFRKYEDFVLNKLSCVISVTPHLVNRISQVNKNVVQITNYPIINNAYIDDSVVKKNNQFCYTGEICPYWNIEYITQAVHQVANANLILVGRSQQPKYEKVIFANRKENIAFYGEVSYDEAEKIRKESIGCFALLSHMPSCGDHLGTLGNTKLFEYMNDRTAVICTDSKLWKEIVEKWNCGICVSPNDTQQIKNAMLYLIEHPEEAIAMGMRGYQAVVKEFNWESQEKKLLGVYSFIANNTITRTTKRKAKGNA